MVVIGLLSANHRPYLSGRPSNTVYFAGICSLHGFKKSTCNAELRTCLGRSAADAVGLSLPKRIGLWFCRPALLIAGTQHCTVKTANQPTL